MDKRNGKDGAHGLRLIHVCDPVGMAWMSASEKAEPSRDAERDTAHGSIAHRCVEDAVAVQLAQGWRMHDLRIDTALGLYDASNAFRCVSISDLDQAASELVPQADMVYHKDAHRLQLVTVEAVDGTLTMRPQEGVLMGSSLGPRKFVRAYCERLQLWSAELWRRDSSYSLLYVRDPVSGRLIDASITSFVDDVGKRHIVR